MDAAHVRLSDYIPSDMFRTVLVKQLSIPCGISELPVVIEFKQKFMEHLEFTASPSGYVYGYVRPNALLQEINHMGKQAKNINRITLHDWDEKFLMTIDTVEPPYEQAFYVQPDEVKELLNSCLRTPEQRVK